MLFESCICYLNVTYNSTLNCTNIIQSTFSYPELIYSETFLYNISRKKNFIVWKRVPMFRKFLIMRVDTSYVTDHRIVLKYLNVAFWQWRSYHINSVDTSVYKVYTEVYKGVYKGVYVCTIKCLGTFDFKALPPHNFGSIREFWCTPIH